MEFIIKNISTGHYYEGRGYWNSDISKAKAYPTSEAAETSCRHHNTAAHLRKQHCVVGEAAPQRTKVIKATLKALTCAWGYCSANAVMAIELEWTGRGDKYELRPMCATHAPLALSTYCEPGVEVIDERTETCNA